ncbi:MAG: 2-hydroxychromene-2-carboxylate isomerase [Myxococcota bacterium]|jgi:2-hydroxychromene-2-carboxylate isomerase|nr:2-hydroxychromene-2-carboxylate isomerase [Myxococcota bacterium]
MKKIEFFWDVGSPYTYLAFTQLAGLKERHQVEIVLRPFLLGGVFRACGNTMPAQVPAKAQYMLHDLKRWAAFYNVPLCGFDEVVFPLNTILPMRVATAALQGGRGDEFAWKVQSAYWGQGKNVSEAEVLGGLLEEMGDGAERFLEAAQDQPIKDALRATTDEAVERGAFGAPAIFVGCEQFWGNDRLALLEEMALNNA